MGKMNLHRVKDSVNPILDDHFHETYGADYGFNADQPSKALETGPGSIRMAQKFLDRLGREELKSKYCGSNSVQALAYMDGMNLDWHVDGETELGGTISTLSLGGDATFHVRMRKYHFESKGPGIVRGSRHYEAIMNMRNRMRDGQDVDVEQFQDLQVARNRTHRPEMKIPLIHGSVVIMQGECFSEYFEHKVENRGPLRFAVTTRMIDDVLHGICILKSKRPNGQLFTAELDDYEPCNTSSSNRTKLPSRSQPMSTQVAGRKRRLPDWYIDETTSMAASKTSASVTNTETIRIKGGWNKGKAMQRKSPCPKPTVEPRTEPMVRSMSMEQSVINLEGGSEPEQHIHKPSTLPTDRRVGIFWAPETYEKLLHLREDLKMSVEDVMKTELFRGHTHEAIRQAVHRGRNRLKQYGDWASVPRDLRASATPSIAQSVSVVGDGSPDRPLEVRGMTPGSGGLERWTKEEEDQLWALRQQKRPLEYKEIARLFGHQRSAKACREKYNLLNKREREKTAVGGAVSATPERAAKRQKRMALPLGPIFEDLGGPMVPENAVAFDHVGRVTRRASLIANAAGADGGSVSAQKETGGSQTTKGSRMRVDGSGSRDVIMSGADARDRHRHRRARECVMSRETSLCPLLKMRIDAARGTELQEVFLETSSWRALRMRDLHYRAEGRERDREEVSLPECLVLMLSDLRHEKGRGLKGVGVSEKGGFRCQRFSDEVSISGLLR